MTALAILGSLGSGGLLLLAVLKARRSAAPMQTPEVSHAPEPAPVEEAEVSQPHESAEDPKPTTTAPPQESDSVPAADESQPSRITNSVKEKPVTTPTIKHHPHFISVDTETHGWGERKTYKFREFTGYEPDPGTISFDPDMPREQWRALSDEYEAARKLWNIARYKRELKTALATAEPKWQHYERSRNTMDAAFSAFRELEDGRWRSQTLKLVDAHSATRKAAQEFDNAARVIADLVEKYRDEVGYDDLPRWESVAKEAGRYVADWYVGDHSDYRYNPYSYDRHTPLVGRVEEEVDRQREQIKDVAALAGDQTEAAR